MLVHLGIKRRNGEPSDFHFLTFGISRIDHLTLGLGLLEFHFFACDFDDMTLRGIGGVGGDDLNAHLTPLRPADLLHDLVQLHVYHILKGFLALSNGRDPIIGLQSAVLVSGPSRDDLHDFRIAVVGSENGPDPHQ